MAATIPCWAEYGALRFLSFLLSSACSRLMDSMRTCRGDINFTCGLFSYSPDSCVCTFCSVFPHAPLPCSTIPSHSATLNACVCFIMGRSLVCPHPFSNWNFRTHKVRRFHEHGTSALCCHQRNQRGRCSSFAQVAVLSPLLMRVTRSVNITNIVVCIFASSTLFKVFFFCVWGRFQLLLS